MINSAFNYRTFLEQAQARVDMLRAPDRERLTASLKQMHTNFFSGPEEEVKENTDAYEALVMRARNGDATATAEATVIRSIRVDNFIKAMSNVMAFFEPVELGQNEIPYIENTSMAEMTVSYIGQDGQARLSQPVKYQEQAQIQLRIISSADFEYPLRDIYRGNVADEAKTLVNIAWDLDRQIDRLTWPYLKSQIGAFTLSGDRAMQTYVAHSAIDSSNLPPGNLLTIPGNTATSPFRKECFDAILQYVASFGNALPGGEVSPVCIYIPSSEAMGFLSQVSLTTFSNSLTEQIFQTGFIFDYGGRKWVIVPDVTLNPNEGLAYVRTNKSVGMFFTKPMFDEVLEDTSMPLRKQNKGRMSMSKVVGWGLPNTAKLNVLAVRYHSDRTLPSSSSSSSH